MPTNLSTQVVAGSQVFSGSSTVPVRVDSPGNRRCSASNGTEVGSRFRLDWSWDGGPALLQSRVIDETGYVQPTIRQLREVRGTRSIYHNNAIQTWRVDATGEVSNVQVL